VGGDAAKRVERREPGAEVVDGDADPERRQARDDRADPAVAIADSVISSTKADPGTSWWQALP
jgi:hypothetical protein